MSSQFSYNKKEKLKSRKLMQQVFSSGKAFTIYPLKVFYARPGYPLDSCVKTGVGVSSRNFKKAVQRNRIKRLLREAYRTEKLPLHTFLTESEQYAAVFILYIDKTMPTFAAIKSKMPAVITRLVKDLHEAAVKNT